MATRKPYMTFKQFLLRQQALSLYRDLLRASRGVGGAREREEMRVWLRAEFERWRHTTDETTIRTLLVQGRASLSEIRTSISMAK